MSIDPALPSPRELAEIVANSPASSELARITIWPPAPAAPPLTDAAFALISVPEPSTHISPVVISTRPASAAAKVETEISAPFNTSKESDLIMTSPPVPRGSSLDVSAAIRVATGPYWLSTVTLGALMIMLPPLVAPELLVVSWPPFNTSRLSVRSTTRSRPRPTPSAPRIRTTSRSRATSSRSRRP